MSTIIVGLLISVGVVAAIRTINRRKKTGNGGCGCSGACMRCSGKCLYENAEEIKNGKE